MIETNGSTITLETMIGWAERNAKACAPDADVAFVAGNADLWQQTADMLKTCRPTDGTK